VEGLGKFEKYSKIMFNILFLFLITIAGLTLIAINNEGSSQKDLKIVLNMISQNSTDLLTNIKKLLLLLIKDIIEVKTIKSDGFSKENNSGTILPSFESEFSETSIDEVSIEADVDCALNQFSPEVVQVIDLEEEKVA
tara:strand:+ start:860 stop:1273 length:414 start_codon:yes stop_codon:yes gene_type:complete